MPSSRLRVVCGLAVTIASFSPTSAFSSVDLPTFGRPSSATTPARCSASAVIGRPRRASAARAAACSALRFERPLPLPQVSAADPHLDA